VPHTGSGPPTGRDENVTAMAELDAVRTSLAAHGQSHLLAFYDELSDARQQALLAQIAAIDFDLLDELIDRFVRDKPRHELPAGVQPAEVIPARPADPARVAAHADARRRGERLVADGKVAAFVVAGGQGTRLGYDGPKGCLQATPVAKKPLFQVFAEQILAAGRRAGKPIPWYVMTSPSNDAATREFFAGRDNFGLAGDDVFFLQQGTMPAIGLDGRMLLAEKGMVATNPNGHGGCLPALRDSGALDDMAGRGVEIISYFQVDSPLVRCIDPLFIGLHAAHRAEMSAKALAKRDPLERLGNFCLIDGRATVVEYSDMPEGPARQMGPDGVLRFSAGSIAIHLLSRTFVERLTAGGKCRLPYHRAEKKAPHVADDGRRVEPAEPNAVKCEMFVFDAMPLAEQTVILQTFRDEEFSPVKNAAGADSLATCLHDQVRRAAQWLEDAGVPVPRDADGQVAVTLEISPLLADSAEQLARSIDPNMKLAAGQSVYLAPPEG